MEILPQFRRSTSLLGRLMLWWGILLLATSCSRSTRDPTPLIDDAARLREAGRYEESLESLNQALAIDPENVIALNDRGRVYCRLGRFDKAREDLSQAIGIDPAYVDAYNHRANAWAEENQFDKALDDLEQAIQLAPTYHAALHNRASILLEVKLYERALDDINRALLIEPNNELSLGIRGLTLAKLRRPAEGIVDLNRALELGPSLAVAWRRRAYVYWQQGCVENAATDIGVALQIEESALSLLVSSFVSASIGDDLGAENDRKRALLLEPTVLNSPYCE